jgi:hypothetical protein
MGYHTQGFLSILLDGLFCSLGWVCSMVSTCKRTHGDSMSFFSHPVFALAFRPKSIFVYFITTFVNRWDWDMGAMFLLLKNMNSSGFSLSLNAMIINQDLTSRESTIRSGLEALGSVYPWVSMNAYNFSFIDLVQQAGVEFPTHVPFLVCMARLYIPLLFKANWFLYVDADIQPVREFFPEIMTFTTNVSKVLFAVPDQTIIMTGYDRRRLQRLNLGVSHTQYFNAGFLFMRSGPALREQLRRAIIFVRKNLNIRYRDQDGLNFGIDRGLLELLPWKFFVEVTAHDIMGNTSYIKHHNGPKFPTTAIEVYSSALFRKVRRDHLASRRNGSRKPEVNIWPSSIWTRERTLF